MLVFVYYQLSLVETVHRKTAIKGNTIPKGILKVVRREH